MGVMGRLQVRAGQAEAERMTTRLKEDSAFTNTGL